MRSPQEFRPRSPAANDTAVRLHLAVCLEKRVAHASDLKQMHVAGGEDRDEHGVSSQAIEEYASLL